MLAGLVDTPLTHAYQVPGAVMAEAKRRYLYRDLQDWAEYSRVSFYWNDNFPLHSVLPLRVVLASGCNPALIKALCEWKRLCVCATEANTLLTPSLSQCSLEG